MLAGRTRRLGPGNNVDSILPDGITLRSCDRNSLRTLLPAIVVRDGSALTHVDHLKRVLFVSSANERKWRGWTIGLFAYIKLGIVRVAISWGPLHRSADHIDQSSCTLLAGLVLVVGELLARQRRLCWRGLVLVLSAQSAG